MKEEKDIIKKNIRKCKFLGSYYIACEVFLMIVHNISIHIVLNKVTIKTTIVTPRKFTHVLDKRT